MSSNSTSIYYLFYVQIVYIVVGCIQNLQWLYAYLRYIVAINMETFRNNCDMGKTDL